MKYFLKRGDMKVTICHSILPVLFFSVALISFYIMFQLNADWKFANFNDFPLLYECILVVIYNMIGVWESEIERYPKLACCSNAHRHEMHTIISIPLSVTPKKGIVMNDDSDSNWVGRNETHNYVGNIWFCGWSLKTNFDL